MKYFSAAPAAVLLAASIFTAGCGQVHVGTVDRERVQNEAPQLQSLVAEANTKLAEAQAEAQQRYQANPNMTPEEAQQVRPTQDGGAEPSLQRSARTEDERCDPRDRER